MISGELRAQMAGARDTQVLLFRGLKGGSIGSISSSVRIDDW